jgi:hypothetical protein
MPRHQHVSFTHINSMQLSPISFLKISSVCSFLPVFFSFFLSLLLLVLPDNFTESLRHLHIQECRNFHATPKFFNQLATLDSFALARTRIRLRDLSPGFSAVPTLQLRCLLLQRPVDSQPGEFDDGPTSSLLLAGQLPQTLEILALLDWHLSSRSPAIFARLPHLALLSLGGLRLLDDGNVVHPHDHLGGNFAALEHSEFLGERSALESFCAEILALPALRAVDLTFVHDVREEFESQLEFMSGSVENGSDQPFRLFFSLSFIIFPRNHRLLIIDLEKLTFTVYSELITLSPLYAASWLAFSAQCRDKAMKTPLHWCAMNGNPKTKNLFTGFSMLVHIQTPSTTVAKRRSTVLVTRETLKSQLICFVLAPQLPSRILHVNIHFIKLLLVAIWMLFAPFLNRLIILAKFIAILGNILLVGRL